MIRFVDCITNASQPGIFKDNLRMKAVSNGYSDEAVVRFNTESTSLADEQYDAWKMTGLEKAPQLYTMTANDEKLAINSLPYSKSAYTVPLNFEMNADQPVTLTFTNILSFAPSVSIFLMDNLTQRTINLRNEPVYTFNHNHRNDASRFKLAFGGTIGNEVPVVEDITMWISGNVLCINALSHAGQTGLVEVYNVSGQKLMNKTLVLSELSTLELNFKGFVIVKLTSGTQKLTTKAILMK
jgi:hypothetical protein